MGVHSRSPLFAVWGAVDTHACGSNPRSPTLINDVPSSPPSRLMAIEGAQTGEVLSRAPLWLASGVLASLAVAFYFDRLATRTGCHSSEPIALLRVGNVHHEGQGCRRLAEEGWTLQIHPVTRQSVLVEACGDGGQLAVPYVTACRLPQTRPCRPGMAEIGDVENHSTWCTRIYHGFLQSAT